MSLFQVSNVNKRYVNHTALSDVSITVPKQSIFGLLGPNGAGKTTLIRIINQIIAPDGGELLFNGEKLQPAHTEKIGYLPEERGLYRKMKVGEQALYLAQLKGLNKSEALRRLKYWFEHFEIQDWWDKKVEELSKGMQQKVQFIVTIIHEPPLLIFDEPFSGFDPVNANLLKDEILKLRDKGATIIFSTHNMGSVEELCDRIALINKSEKILEGRVKDIRDEYRSETFEVFYEGYTGLLKDIIPADFDILYEKEEEDHHRAKIKLPRQGKPNDLLELLISKVTLTGFHEIIPSMNDIFISKVTNKAPHEVEPKDSIAVSES
ncbi:MAG: ATP-binding cassette domain-containing protein [Bacteroidales bacterium]|nr:ATP-binding cassette domain-containing protein [Bacteroidales bacterium]